MSNYIQAQTLGIIDTSAPQASYVLIYTLEHPSFYIKITSSGSSEVYISFDGVNDHDYFFSSGVHEFPFQDQGVPNNFVALWKKGQKIYAKWSGGVNPGLLISAYYLGESNG